MPKGIIEDINDLSPDENYLLVLVRHKTKEEIKLEEEVSNGLSFCLEKEFHTKWRFPSKKLFFH